MTEPWDYLEKTPARDAPICDNPSGMYCPDCRASGCAHCAHPEYCGGMRLMRKVEMADEGQARLNAAARLRERSYETSREINREAKMSLFVTKDFQSSSGVPLSWKIECDNLTEKDLKCFAKLIGSRFRFSEVLGIPRGGLAIATHLAEYVNPAEDRILLVDDVFTTGESIRASRKKIMEERGLEKKHVIGVVLFARNTPPKWVWPVFELSGWAKDKIADEDED